MNLVYLFKLFLFPQKGWRDLIDSGYSIHRLFLLHVVPFSLIPPIFIYVAGQKNQILFFNLLSPSKLILACIAFFIIELIAVPIMALVIKQISEIAEVKPTYHQAFKLAAVAPTPLWMMPVFLLVPDISVLMVVGSLAMMAAAGFIYYGIPEVLNVYEEGHHLLLFGAVLTAGMMAWGLLMISTFVIWGSLQNLQFSF
jgi:hypothetical protein